MDNTDNTDYLSDYDKSIISRSKMILSIDTNNLSSLSKLYLISIIKLNCDLLNDFDLDDNIYNKKQINEINELIEKIFYLHEKFAKYYVSNGDYYFTDYGELIPKSFLTYVSESVNNYYSQDDIKVKCIILEDFMEIYDYSKFKYLNEKLNLIDINKIKLTFNNWKKSLAY